MNDMARSGVMIRRENSDSVAAEEAAVLASFDTIVVVTRGPRDGLPSIVPRYGDQATSAASG